MKLAEIQKILKSKAENRTRDISKIGRVTAGNRDFHIKNIEDIKYAMRLIIQAYNVNIPTKGG